MSTPPILLEFPEEFESERLIIRAPRHGDGAMFAEAVNESVPELRASMVWAQQELSVQDCEVRMREARARFVSRADIMLLLVEKRSGMLVGGSGLHRIDWAVSRFEIGYWQRTRFVGNGFLTEAVHRITRFALETLHARRVEIRVDPRNERSWRIPERLGFVLEGTLRDEALDPAGALRSTRVYSRTPADPPMPAFVVRP